LREMVWEVLVAMGVATGVDVSRWNGYSNPEIFTNKHFRNMQAILTKHQPTPTKAQVQRTKNVYRLNS